VIIGSILQLSQEKMMAKRILCVEDDIEMRASLKFMLEIKGFEIDEAGDGKEGVDLALEKHPDLILCDINMPVMDGFETVKELKKHQSTANIPIVFMSGLDPRAQMGKRIEFNADDFIQKPFKMEELIRTMKRYLRKAEHYKKNSIRNTKN
jgi:DNA-binding response OmpR family regulator